MHGGKVGTIEEIVIFSKIKLRRYFVYQKAVHRQIVFQLI